MANISIFFTFTPQKNISYLVNKTFKVVGSSGGILEVNKKYACDSSILLYDDCISLIYHYIDATTVGKWMYWSILFYFIYF